MKINLPLKSSLPYNSFSILFDCLTIWGNSLEPRAVSPFGCWPLPSNIRNEQHRARNLRRIVRCSPHCSNHKETTYNSSECHIGENSNVVWERCYMDVYLQQMSYMIHQLCVPFDKRFLFPFQRGYPVQGWQLRWAQIAQLFSVISDHPRQPSNLRCDAPIRPPLVYTIQPRELTAVLPSEKDKFSMNTNLDTRHLKPKQEEWMYSSYALLAWLQKIVVHVYLNEYYYHYYYYYWYSIYYSNKPHQNVGVSIQLDLQKRTNFIN